MIPNGKLGNFSGIIQDNKRYNLTITTLELYTNLTARIVRSWTKQCNKSGSCIRIGSDVIKLIADYNEVTWIEWEDYEDVDDRTQLSVLTREDAWDPNYGWQHRTGVQWVTAPYQSDSSDFDF